MFVYKSPKEFEQLSEYQQEKYLDEKSKHEIKQAQQAAEDAAQKAVDKAMEAAVKATDEKIEAVKESYENKLTSVKDEYDKKIEKAQAEMSRAKIAERSERVKDLTEAIEEKFNTPEGEAMLKNITTLRMEVEANKLSKPSTGMFPQYAGNFGPGHDDFHARNLLRVFPTSADIINYTKYVVDAAKAGIGVTLEGTQKPEFGYTPTLATAPVVKIAGLLHLSDEFLEDVTGASAFISSEAVSAYLDAEDLQIYKGTGTAGSATAIRGLWTNAGAQVFPQGSVNAGSNVWDKLVAAATQIRKNKRNATAYVISPQAYQELLINKDINEAYTYPIVMGNDGILRAGGIPIYWSNVFGDTEGLVGDFARGSAIFQKKAMEIAYSAENKDNFEKNMVTLRIEGRIALPIYYDNGFAKLDLATPATT